MTLLSFHGRCGRVRYLLESLGPYVVLIALVIAMIVLGNGAGRLPSSPSAFHPAPGFWAAVIAFVLGCGLGVWIEIAAQVRRLHDLGQSGWLAALNLVPGVSPLMWLVLVLAPGQPHDNVYGVAARPASPAPAP